MDDIVVKTAEVFFFPQLFPGSCNPLRRQHALCMEYNPIHSKFWSDSWVRSLNALDRYLFLYLKTNSHNDLTGIYELPLDLMAAESGIDEKDLRLSMLTRLEPKVYYKENWVIITNHIKYRVSSSPKLMKGISKQLSAKPSHILELAKSLGYPIDTIVIPSRIRIDKIRGEENRIDISRTEVLQGDITIVKDEDRVVKPRTVKYPNAKEVFSLWKNPPRNWQVNKTQLSAAQRLFEDKGLTKIKNALEFVEEHSDETYCPQVTSPHDLESKWPKLLAYREKV